MKSAFTLAETLLTLIIIGVIAAMTIPSVQNIAKQRELDVKLAKTYATLSQITSIMMEEKGPMKYWDRGSIYNEYKKHLNVVKTCPPDSGCMSTDKVKLPRGGTDIAYADSGILLADGTGIMMNLGTGAVDNYGLSDSDKSNAVMTMQVDMNGTLPPNRWGSDRWLLILVDKKGLVPSGWYDESKCKDVYGCAATVIKGGKK